ncbi:quinone oxidoreductase family protein [Burkholderia multivorans]|uniref:quinone oxidoreductase family protein n=1 Tax=Burkholderia multivorans TaxID=87883 RepID=UPI001C2186C5|nr:quinone oxidoreductase [Burkholderia multivorans]MBU9607417.1 quinone oxidoreductase [Burkholderia multivorans]MBU9626588.1 quinone oxidoreductase [Burkholderia multivorans]
MARAIRVHETGGPDVLRWEQLEVGAPGKGELRIRHTAVGLNYIDVYHREGSYPLHLPTGLGVEAAGIVEAVGPEVQGFSVGDRVVYAGGPPGAYATERLLPAARAAKLPAGVSDQLAASVFFKGLTAEYLIRRCHEVAKGDIVLWHAAAGGVGSLACQWLNHIGATVIGTVGTDEKAQRAKENGCSFTINYRKEDFVALVKEITGGKLVSAVYDSVGKDTILGSLDCLRPRGILVSFGTASGPTPSIDLAALGARGSLYVTRASIAHYTAQRAEFEAGADAVFKALGQGILKVTSPTTYPLDEVAQAHRDIQGGKTTGSVVLTL